MKKGNSIRNQIIIAALAFSVIALLFGLWSYSNTRKTSHTELNLQGGTAFPIPRIIQSFQLKNAPTGSVLDNQQLKGHWTFLFFGFTHCASLCPSTLTMLNNVYTQLSTDVPQNLPHVIFISIDPDRDSLKRINTYVTSFNPHFKGATGTQSQLDKLTQELNILYAKVNPTEGEDYQIDHSGTVLVINPDGNLAALFSPPIEAKTLAQDYKLLIQ